MASLRSEGRAALSLRALSCEQGMLERADGSARFSHGGTTVMAAVYGPVEAPVRLEHVDRAVVQVTIKAMQSPPSSRDSAIALMVRRTFEPIVLRSLHPRTSISVILHIIDDNGSALPACLNAAGLALIDAGISCTSIVSACTIAIKSNGLILLDPDQNEEDNALSVLSFAFSSTEKDSIMSTTHGRLSESAYFDCLELAQKSCSRIEAFLTLAITNKIPISSRASILVE